MIFTKALSIFAMLVVETIDDDDNTDQLNLIQDFE